MRPFLKMKSLGLILGLLSCLTLVTALDECLSNPCKNGATCVDGLQDYYTCLCNGNWEGENCDVQPPTDLCPFGNIYNFVDSISIEPLEHRFECNSVIRLHGAKEVNVTFTTFQIETDKDVLWFYPGLASDSDNDAYPGYDDANPPASRRTYTESNFWLEVYTDKNVVSQGFAIEISADGDDCLPGPCLNGATCVDLVRDYTCVCAPGFEGDNCQNDTNICRDDPCKNGGTCNEFITYYNCTCPPSYTGEFCETGVVIVESTLPIIDDSTYWAREGNAIQSLEFDYVVTPSAMASYSIGGVGTFDDLWSIAVFFSSSSDGLPALNGEQTLTTLTSEQKTALFDPPSTTTFSDVQAPAVSVPSDVVCADMQYFCARLDKGENPLPNFELIGDPDENSLLGCRSVTCRGVEIFNTTVDTSDAILEGTLQSVIFDVTLFSDPEAGSVSGTDLLDLTVFLSVNEDGSGTRLEASNVVITDSGFTGITAGTPTDINGLEASVDLRDGPTCSQFSYLCVEVAKGSSPSVDFTFEGSTSTSLLGCQLVVCTGVLVTNTDVTVTSGTIREGISQIVNFDVDITADISGGSVRGSDLWLVTAFGSADSSGNGVRVDPQNVSLDTTQGSTSVTAGFTSVISGLDVIWDLADGSPYCADFEYFCVQIDKNPGASIDFELSGLPSDDVLTSCQRINCSGVEIITTFVETTTGDILEGTDQDVGLRVVLDSDSNGGSVNGDGLWQITAYLNKRGDGTRLEVTTLILTGDQAGTDIIAGNPAQIQGITFPLGLAGGPTTCSDFDSVCVEISQGASPSPSFSLDSETGQLIGCQEVNCRGVLIRDIDLDLQSGDIKEGINNQLTFNLSLGSDLQYGSVSGTDLWDFTAFGSAALDGSGPQVFLQPVMLGAQISKSLTAGVYAVFTSLVVSWDLSAAETCSDVEYICIDIGKNPAADPDFMIEPTSVVSECFSLDCRGVEVTDTTLIVTSGSTLIERDLAHQITFNLTIESNPDGGSVSGIDLWSIEAYASDRTTFGGSKINPVDVTLDFTQGSTGIVAGVDSTIIAVNADLNLDGNLCSDLAGICVELSKNPASDPDFTLDAYPSVLVSCYPASCSGVQVTDVTYTLEFGGPIQAGSPTNNLTFSVDISSDPDGASVSGSDLWEVDIFLNDQLDGEGNTTHRHETVISPESNSKPLTAGVTLTLDDVSTILDLFDYDCASVPFVCLELGKNRMSSPDFTLTATSSLIYCRKLPCENTNECEPEPCMNGGTCTDLINDFVCSCAPGYTGKNCDTEIDECASGPCMNDGTCTDFVNGFVCDCAPGYTGTYCNQDIDECNSNPCENGASCINEHNNYTCHCQPGYTGVHCETDIDECASIPCVNGGTCTDGINRFDCTCLDGWAGPTCERDIDECASDPCRNGGTCTHGIDFFVCQCVRGWTGTTCDTDIDECFSSPCGNGDCTDGIGFYFCTCDAGWKGVNCDIEIDECASNPCANGGTCNDMLDGYTCDCVPGWTGVHCLTDINECLSEPCQNGGTCNNLIDEYRCDCLPGYTGVNCETDIDECGSTPCQNGGTCSNLIDMFNCICPPLFTGTMCEIPITACTSEPCQNDGTCDGDNDGFTCNCAPGWTGVTCEIEIDECDSSPCKNGGTCTDGIDHFYCECTSSWTGTTCETERRECDSNPCQNGGTCNDYLGNYTCSCVPGYTGTHCETDINECASDPCLNGGTCLNLVNQYSCQCMPGYTGANCQTDINECAPTPCQNGGTCEDEVNLYICICVPGWGGTNCQTDEDECASMPCLNGGTCSHGTNIYTCSCAPGYTGPNCEFDIDECASSPCLNGGTCNDGIDQYTCTCRNGFTGTHCETDIDECESMPCQNGGTCYDQIDYYSCFCVIGYAGVNCQTDIDECASEPCQSGGTCVDEVNGYTCICPSGREGLHCELDSNECASNPCMNGGSCFNLDDAFSCTCVPGYTGTRCLTDIDECNSDPCQNGGTCTEFVDFFSCECPAGYEGVWCESDINECASNPCRNGGTCNDHLDSFTCTCPPGWTGVLCEELISPCTSDPCVNGYCLNQVNNYICECFAGWTGDICDTDIDECASNPCYNGGTCDNGPNKYSCTCAPGWTGYDCDEDVNECHSNPCSNGGTCNNFPNAYNCTCPSGFMGYNCELDVDECKSDPCLNGGSCLNYLDMYVCRCPPSYTGTHCEIEIDECYSDPCQNEGTCVDEVNRYTCICAPGWMGIHCEIPINECSSNPCVYGVCLDEPYGYVCLCDVGWTGVLCDINIDDCNDTTCDNGGTCVDGVNSFTCVCPPGWTGIICEIDINECTSMPCQNGGTCNDLLNAFECMCPDGYTGTFCELEIGGCSSQPCQNGGLCYNEPDNTYLCHCQPGFTGTNCEIDIDECASDPCMNGGTCEDQVNGFVCQCAPGYTGSTCAININECSSDPCLHEGICIDHVNFYTCLCQQGYTGINCETNTDECASNPCMNGATCENRPGEHGYDCVCTPGFTGFHCQTNIDDCESAPCLNGGICIDGINYYTCTCPQGWTGVNCETAIGCRVNYTLAIGEKIIINSPKYPSNYGLLENCMWIISGIDSRTVYVDFKDFITENRYDVLKIGVGNDPNKGTERLGNSGSGPITPDDLTLKSEAIWLTFTSDNEKTARGFSIEIRDEFYKVYTPCDANPCINGATCTDVGTTQFQCECTDLWEGVHCQTPTVFNPCGLYPCGNGAECINNGDNYTCVCLAGYTGRNCLDDVNECEENPCSNGGMCVNLVNGYVCVCAACYSGSLCEEAPNSACDVNPCSVDGSDGCTYSGGGYQCTCKDPYIGDYCETHNDECDPDPCFSGTCMTVDGSYSCTCDGNWIGTKCDIEVTDECIMENPCLNGATCSYVDGVYSCQCVTGFEGEFCDYNIDECEGQNCSWHGVCADGIGESTCVCDRGYTGSICQTDINDCESDPCLNSGVCKDELNGFVCTCNAGFEQPICKPEYVAPTDTVPKVYTFKGNPIDLNPYYIMLIVGLGLLAIFFFILFCIANKYGSSTDQYDPESAEKGFTARPVEEIPTTIANDYDSLPLTEHTGHTGGVNELNSFENPWPETNDDFPKTQL